MSAQEINRTSYYIPTLNRSPNQELRFSAVQASTVVIRLQRRAEGGIGKIAKQPTKQITEEEIIFLTRKTPEGIRKVLTVLTVLE